MFQQFGAGNRTLTDHDPTAHAELLAIRQAVGLGGFRRRDDRQGRAEQRHRQVDGVAAPRLGHVLGGGDRGGGGGAGGAGGNATPGNTSTTIHYRVPIPYTVGTGASTGNLSVSWPKQ